MSDHYKTLGISKTASKPEIKDAFRKLAIQFHPDKHSHSSQPARDAATHKFKQVSEAYDVLIDDRKRAAYNISLYNPTNNNYSYGYGYGYDSSYYQRGRSYYRRPMSENAAPRFGSRLEAVLKYMTTRSFLLHLTLAGMVLGGSVAIDRSMEALWKMANHGKSFEEAMESIDHNKARKGE